MLASSSSDGLPSVDGAEAAPNISDPNAALRFEDLTIDDDLSLLDRVVRYVRSGIALQRLVHVKMLAETARSVGTSTTIRSLVSLLSPLVSDAESIIRQHLASQLLPLAVICMFDTPETPRPFLKDGESRIYHEQGYRVVTSAILNHLNKLVIDTDVDVRKAASDALATLALYIKKEDIAPMILPIPLRLAHEQKQRQGNNLVGNKLEKESVNRAEDLRITAVNLLADISSLHCSHITFQMVSQYVTPCILQLCQDQSFRVRRASVQALPRVVSGSSPDDAVGRLLPAFTRLSDDEMYRVRKSVGECLVDMSRSLMLLVKYGEKKGVFRSSMNKSINGSNNPFDEDFDETASSFNKLNHVSLKRALMAKRRNVLIGIAVKLLGDSNKFVRHGMMQFLGPFIASFYPLDRGNNQNTGGIIAMLGGSDDQKSDDENINMNIPTGGLGVQFFPHANGMVSRLNPHHLTEKNRIEGVSKPSQTYNDDDESYKSNLPEFLEKSYYDSVSIYRILKHRKMNPPSIDDTVAVQKHLLRPFVNLATISSGDENVDAEMRVYCAYSLPAVILLLSNEGWELSLRECFLALVTGVQSNKSHNSSQLMAVPLPVKRCLASSFHTVCQIIGPGAMIGTEKEQESGRDLFSVFQTHFLKDTDDTVRLNIIRNLPSILALLPYKKRSEFLPTLSEIITGDSMLGAVRRSASNPSMLNWRQRDMVAQILPFLICLYKPKQVKSHMWPIATMLMSDSVNLVRANVEWSIPVLFRKFEELNYEKEEFSEGGSTNKLSAEATEFSADACGTILEYLQRTMLEMNEPKGNKTKSKFRSTSAFSKRQEYCRICAAVALSLRVGGDDRKSRKRNNRTKTNEFITKLESGQLPHPFLNLLTAEYRHIHHILKNYLLPEAIEMKDDRVTNVRLTLAKCLRVMPSDIRDNGEVKKVLRILEDEAHTWEGGGGMYMDDDNEDPTNASNLHSSHTRNQVGSATNSSSTKSNKSASGTMQVGVTSGDNLYSQVTFDKRNLSKDWSSTGPGGGTTSSSRQKGTSNSSDNRFNIKTNHNVQRSKATVVQDRVSNYESRRSAATDLMSSTTDKMHDRRERISIQNQKQSTLTSI